MNLEQMHQRLQQILGDNLPTELPSRVLQYTRDPNLRLILITGSAAQNRLNTYSDIDLVFLMGQPDHHYPPYQLDYLDQRLVSFSVSTFQEWRDQLGQLDQVRYLRDAILHASPVYEVAPDLYQQLWQLANEVDPSSYELERKQMIRRLITGYVEEVHKLFNGVADRDDLQIYYALLGLQLGTWQILFHHYDLYLVTENDTISAVLDALELDDQHQMVEWWQVMWAIDHYHPMQQRGQAAIRFYLQLIQLVDPHLDEQQRQFLQISTQLAHQLI